MIDAPPFKVEEFQGARAERSAPPIPPLIHQFVWDGDRVPAPPDELIEDMVGERSILFIGGQSGAGKSFIIMEMARCLMTGTAFFGHEVTRRVGVAVLAPEGDETLTGRLEALKREHGLVGRRLPFVYLGAVPDLKKPEERQRIKEALRAVNERMLAEFGMPLGIVFLDTLVASFDLDDENDNSEASKIIRFLKEIRDDLRITVAPVHHYGKSAETGLRGASGWRAGVDELLSVTAERNELTGEVGSRELNIAKHRNGREGPVAPFELEFVQLGLKPSGKPWGSLVVVPRLDLPTTAAATRKRPAGTKPSRTMDQAFDEAIIAAGEPYRTFSGTGPTVRAVRIVPALREHFYARYQTGADDPDKSELENEKARSEAKRKAFSRAMNSLSDKYVTDEASDRAEWIWLAEAEVKA